MIRWVAGVGALMALAGIATVPPDLSAAVSPPRDLVTGRGLYTRYCTACHGESGRGDGPSATAFATKPADLTDGRVLNPLPDAFLVNVVINGGPAEGLAPTMPPFRGHVSEGQARQIAAYIRSLADPPYQAARTRPVVAVGGAPRQPIFFSHLIHAGSFQIPCQYCHADARRSDYAGLPSVERCMGCHKLIGAQDNPEIQKIHQYWNRGTPIPWRRVFKVPEFTAFAHKPHIRAAIACQRCHGPIERMRVVGAVTGPSLAGDLLNLVGIRSAPPLLTMGWCVECHREQNATKGTRAPLECVACHH